jgi:hypothetical protein
MKRATPLAAWAAFCCCAPIIAAESGMAHDANGVVYAPNEALAQAVLHKAGEYRRDVALEWLGEELPPSVGRMRIHVHLSDADRGQTWANDSPGRKYHTLWLHGSEETVTGGLLKHEVTHAVLATQFPEGLPPLIDEGIASTADDPARKAIRSRILDWYTRTGNWPRLERLLESRLIAAEDQQSYAIASSVVEYLLTRGDKATLLRFARSGKANGWDQALRMHYHIGGVAQLESQWQAWAARQTGAAQMATNQVAGKANLK